MRDLSTDPTCQEIIETAQRSYCPTREQMEWLLDHRSTAVGPLLTLLKEATQWDAVPEERSDGSMHAIFLLAALEAQEAWPALANILRKDFDGFVDPFFGDILTECLPWAVARIAKDRPEDLIQLAGDIRLNSWIRNLSLRALGMQALLWPDKQERIICEMQGWMAAAYLDPDPTWPTHLICTVADLGGPQRLWPGIHNLFEQGLIDLGVIQEEDVCGPPEVWKARRSIFEIYTQYGWMIAWQDPQMGGSASRRKKSSKGAFFEEKGTSASARLADATARERLKIGRNAPCPCGSGKKFKKCCLNREGSSSAGI